MRHNDNIKDQGINATNQDFRRYEQVNKKQSYHLSEHLENEEFDEDFEIKTIDFSLFSEGSLDGKIQFASQLGVWILHAMIKRVRKLENCLNQPRLKNGSNIKLRVMVLLTKDISP